MLTIDKPFNPKGSYEIQIGKYTLLINHNNKHYIIDGHPMEFHFAKLDGEYKLKFSASYYIPVWVQRSIVRHCLHIMKMEEC